MEAVLVVLACICLLAGLAGSVMPILPGPPLSYMGLLLLQWSGVGGFSTDFLLIWAAIAIVVTLLDYYLPVWMTKRFGGSRAGTAGATIGLIAGFFIFPPIGIIILPFAGALIGELIHDRENSARAFKVAFGSFAAFFVGTGLKLIVCVVMIVYSVTALFQ